MNNAEERRKTVHFTRTTRLRSPRWTPIRWTSDGWRRQSGSRENRRFCLMWTHMVHIDRVTVRGLLWPWHDRGTVVAGRKVGTADVTDADHWDRLRKRQKESARRMTWLRAKWSEKIAMKANVWYTFHKETRKHCCGKTMVSISGTKRHEQKRVTITVKRQFAIPQRFYTKLEHDSGNGEQV